jgi:hypothetical protein
MAKPAGLPASNVIFFMPTKKTKQRELGRCAGHDVLEEPLVI